MFDRPVKYAIISPVRDEERFIEYTLFSVITQSVLPQVWIIIDDGSNDGTMKKILSYSNGYNFIRIMTSPVFHSLESGSKRMTLASIPRAFNYALKTVNLDDYEFIVKLDGDLSLGCAYFERIFDEFRRDPKLGIAGGHCYQSNQGRLSLERVPDSHVRGATKVFRRECFQDIGGIVEALGWDTIDEIRAQMLGWTTRSFREPKVIHHRLAGSRDNILRGKIRHGHGSYVIGYHPLFMIVRALRRTVDPPYLIGGLALLWGYVLSWARGCERFEDVELRRYIRRQQLMRLFGPLGKRFFRKSAV